jgi:hypothetical protein
LRGAADALWCKASPQAVISTRELSLSASSDHGLAEGSELSEPRLGLLNGEIKRATQPARNDTPPSGTTVMPRILAPVSV